MKQRTFTHWLIGTLLVAVTTAFAPSLAEAKRFGGGKSVGMQRTPAQSPPPAQQTTPNQAAAPTAGAAPAATPKRSSWMGPIAGLAAGLGIAALMSHLGLSETMGNIVMMVLLALVAAWVIRFVMRRMSGTQAASRRNGMPQFAMAGAGSFGQAAPTAHASPADTAPTMVRSALSNTAMNGGGSTGGLPAGFDAAGFERIAKMIFIRLQAANDTADLNDLRTFTTPEMYASIKLDLQDRGNAAQQTDVVRVDAEVLEVAQEDDRQVVSVRFSGLIREEAGGMANDFDEVWHLVKPMDDSRSWMIAGISQQTSQRQ